MARVCPIRLISLSVILTGCGDDARSAAEPRLELDGPAFTLPSADSLLHDVRDMAVVGPMLWVLTSFEPHLHGFDRDGNALVSTGVGGQGPSELGTPWSLVLPAPDDTAAIYVWDAGDRRLEGFDASGRHVADRRIEVDYGPVLASFDRKYVGEALRVRRLGRDLVISTSRGQTSQTRSLWSSALTFVNEDGELKELLSFGRFLDVAPQELPEVFAPAPLWSACGTEALLVFDPLGGFVHAVLSSGIRDSVRVDRTHPTTTHEDVQRWARFQLLDEAREDGFDPDAPEVRAMFDDLVRELTVSDVGHPVSLRCDTEGRGWLQAFSTDSDPRGYGRTWNRVEPPLTVTFPAGFQPHVFGRDRVYGVLTDELGVQRVGWIQGMPN